MSDDRAGRILVLTPDLRLPGGVTNYYNAMALDREPGIEYFPVNTLGSESRARLALRLTTGYCKFIQTLVRQRVRLVHVNPSFNARSFFRDGIFVFLCLLFRKQLLVFFRGWEESFEARVHRSALLKLFFNATYRRSRNMVVLGGMFKEKLIALGADKSRFWLETVVAGDIPGEDFSVDKKVATLDHAPTLLFMSRIEKDKGVYVAIDAYRHLLERHPRRGLKLIVAGEGAETHEVRAYARQIPAADIVFPGYISGQPKTRVLSDAHILVFPTSHGEGMPNVILEAMLYGMPIVSRSIATVPDIVTNGENGFLTASEDPQIFADLICALLLDKKKYREVASTNHERAASLYTTPKVKARLLRVYDAVLAP
ncbi:MAG: glycosyltransferase family 4 protein [Gammaproteobacteria bacterium]